MNAKTFTFSVVIPTHKRSVLLARALSSLKSQAGASAVELIIISDVIDSLTDEVCNSLLGTDDIYIRRNGVAGPFDSRNLGLSIASGQYILFLDDDDAWHTDFLVHFHQCISLHPQQPMYFDCSVVKESRTSCNPLFISESFLNLADSSTKYNFD